jgi:hypothetical protein
MIAQGMHLLQDERDGSTWGLAGFLVKLTGRGAVPRETLGEIEFRSE